MPKNSGDNCHLCIEVRQNRSANEIIITKNKVHRKALKSLGIFILYKKLFERCEGIQIVAWRLQRALALKKLKFYAGDSKMNKSYIGLSTITFTLLLSFGPPAKAQDFCAELFHSNERIVFQVSISNAEVSEMINLTHLMGWPLRSEILGKFFNQHLAELNPEQAISLAKAVGKNNIKDDLLWAYLHAHITQLTAHETLKLVKASSSYNYRNPMLQNYLRRNLMTLNIHEAMGLAEFAGDNRFINDMLWDYIHAHISSLNVSEAMKLAAGTRDNLYYNDMVANYLNAHISVLSVHDALKLAESARDNRWINSMLLKYAHANVSKLSFRDIMTLSNAARSTITRDQIRLVFSNAP